MNIFADVSGMPEDKALEAARAVGVLKRLEEHGFRLWVMTEERPWKPATFEEMPALAKRACDMSDPEVKRLADEQARMLKGREL